MTEGEIVLVGAVIVTIPVLLGLLIANWPRPDTRQRPKRRNESVGEMLENQNRYEDCRVGENPLDNYPDVPWPLAKGDNVHRGNFRK